MVTALPCGEFLGFAAQGAKALAGRVERVCLGNAGRGDRERAGLLGKFRRGGPGRAEIILGESVRYGDILIESGVLCLEKPGCGERREYDGCEYGFHFQVNGRKEKNPSGNYDVWRFFVPG